MATNGLIFDLQSSEFHKDPYAVYARLRSNAPVFRHPGGFVLLTRYEDCLMVLRDNRFGREGFELVMQTPFSKNAKPSYIAQSMLFRNPPDHTRLRLLVNKAFTPRVVEGMREHIQSVVDRLIESRLGSGQINVIDDLAYPLPLIVVCELLGVPAIARRDIREWTAELMRGLEALGPSDIDRVIRGNNAQQKLADYFRTLIAERRTAPGDDLLSQLIAAEEAGDILNNEELLATCVLLFVAGHETTVNLIGNGVLALLRHRDQLEELRSNPDLFGCAIDEMLRYDPPIQRTARMPAENVTLNNHTFKKGEMVIVALGAANRDPAQFQDPDRFDIHRRNNRHLAFGFGIHFCVGSALARMEAQIAIAALIRRIPELALATEHLEWRQSTLTRGLNHLHVVW